MPENKIHACLPLIGQLLAQMVCRAVQEGRAFVDEAGVAHLIDERPLTVVQLSHSELAPSREEAYHAA